ncbi:anthranilate phosphoribosyltransferase [Govanella unica]|uniref:Anthranilate phosphoribosyltransferase n=1 Tax=Govanella unica TaxID=2975056 RepID=A0A9X3TXG5_9PROT|nr:anthranilate phosphoribosyltransferase [Govania unica]MDA5193790.1 anthranilate phosphoribosyltransferase [Govania unica]
MSRFKELIAKVADGTTLSEAEANEAFHIMMSGDATPSQVGGFLMALRVRGETVDELTGACRAMRDKVLAVKAPPGAIDTCGTGGDSAGTYNISTATAIVIAAAGIPVAKHGNRAVSSKSGSADVLAELGINIDAPHEILERCLNEVNIAFLMAPRHHGAMRHVAPTRGELGTRTLFNLLGPLANPALAKRQVIGVFDRKWIAPMAEVLGRTGSERVWVVHGSDGLDEITTTGTTYVAEYDGGSVHTFEITPEEAGLPRARMEDLKGGDAATNAEAIRDLLSGKPGPYRDIVLLNAAASLIVTDRVKTLKEGVQFAAQIIDTGRAAETLDRWIDLSNFPVETAE